LTRHMNHHVGALPPPAPSAGYAVTRFAASTSTTTLSAPTSAPPHPSSLPPPFGVQMPPGGQNPGTSVQTLLPQSAYCSVGKPLWISACRIYHSIHEERSRTITSAGDFGTSEIPRKGIFVTSPSAIHADTPFTIVFSSHNNISATIARRTTIDNSYP